jgi:hypothetical protein
MFVSWEIIRKNFHALSHSMRMVQEERVKGERSGIRAQLQELVTFLNDVGAKTRLLSANIGQYPRAEEKGDPTMWEAMSELNTEFQIIKTVTESLPSKDNDGLTQHFEHFCSRHPPNGN